MPREDAASPASAGSGTVEYVWAAYREWDATAQALKASQSNWQRRVLALTLLGSLLGALTPLPLFQAATSVLLSFATALAVGGASYFGREVLGAGRERDWYRARGIAEALKAEVILFIMRAPPYDTAAPPHKHLARRHDEIVANGSDIPVTRLPEAERRRERPAAWTVDEYIARRVNDQIEYYSARSERYAKIVARCRHAALWIGAAGVMLSSAGGLLGLAGKQVTQEGSATALGTAFVGIVTVLGASVAAYLYSGRYAFLDASYRAAARSLELHLSEWKDSNKTDAERDTLVLECETLLAAEHAAWLAEWRKKPVASPVPTEASPPIAAPAQLEGS